MAEIDAIKIVSNGEEIPVNFGGVSIKSGSASGGGFFGFRITVPKSSFVLIFCTRATGTSKVGANISGDGVSSVELINSGSTSGSERATYAVATSKESTIEIKPSSDASIGDVRYIYMLDKSRNHMHSLKEVA